MLFSGYVVTFAIHIVIFILLQWCVLFFFYFSFHFQWVDACILVAHKLSSLLIKLESDIVYINGYYRLRLFTLISITTFNEIMWKIICAAFCFIFFFYFHWLDRIAFFTIDTVLFGLDWNLIIFSKKIPTFTIINEMQKLFLFWYVEIGRCHLRDNGHKLWFM